MRSSRGMVRFAPVCCACLVGWCCVAAVVADDRTTFPQQDAVLYPRADPGDPGVVHWASALIERIPPLVNDPGDRWPLMLWRVVTPGEITGDLVDALLARGLVPALPLARDAVGAALIVQRSGAPVILTHGKGVQWPARAWPYSLIADRSKWAYQYPEDATIPEHWRSTPVPTLFAGWALAAAELKELLGLMKNSGVEVAAVWLDYEGEPRFADYRAALASQNGRRYLPRIALRSPTDFARYTRQLWSQLLSAYVAGPVREIYPRASVTNWVATLSLPEFPVQRWSGDPVPTLGPTLFTATNPVAYGVDTAFLSHAQAARAATQRQVDRLYTSILLRHVSADSYARARIAPEMESIVWVARWVADQPETRTPMMSRSAYREALRHIWLRGAAAMQIFSPVRAGFSDLAVQEIQDAAAVFDEMLRYRTLMSRGEVLNFDFDLTGDAAVLWSGMRYRDRAVIRVTGLAGRPDAILVSPWPDARIQLAAPIGGATYRLRRNAQTNLIDTWPPDDP